MFKGEPVSGRAVTERDFALQVEGRTVPGVLWQPESAAGTRPLVLLGHGGSGHKREDYIRALARRLVRHLGFAAAAIDGPMHGDRRPDGGLDRDRVWDERQRMRTGPDQTDAMVADWRATLDWLQSELGAGPVGYWGLSMGTVYGLPFVAAEPRVDAAVLGLMGAARTPVDDVYRARMSVRFAGDAPRITIPLLFLVQWDDELVPRDDAIHLFGLFGSERKSMHVNVGRHAAVPAIEYDASERFFEERLSPAPVAA
jgi:dienelactone hydrolase